MEVLTMGKHKKEHKEIYDRLIKDYKYNGDDPRDEICFDTALDKILKYDTIYPKHDKNDYTKANTRDYAKPDKDKE